MAKCETLAVYTCEKCGKRYLNEYAANKCCAPSHCSVCGCETPKYILKCDLCREKELYAKAKKMTLKEYEDQHPDLMLFYNDEYFDGIDALTDYCLYHEISVPEYVYGTEIVYGEIDVDNVLESIEENLNCEDCSFSNKARSEFEAFAKHWNKIHKLSCFNVDESIVVLIPPEEREGTQYD